MRKSTFVISVLVAVAVVAAGGLFASNMGFKLNYQLAAAGDSTSYGTSQSGNNVLALPYNRQAGIDDSQQLVDDIVASGGAVTNVQRFDEATDGLETFTPGAKGATPFALVPGEALFVVMAAGGGVDYITVGSHDPSLSVPLEGPADPGSASGSNFFAVPYHTTAADSQDLVDSIGAASVTNVQRFNESNDGIEIFTPGAKGAVPFPVVAGEGYFVTMSATVNHVPSHF